MVIMLSQTRIRFFVDTNVLVRAMDDSESENKVAEELFKIIKQSHGYICVSTLVLSELFTIMCKKGLSPDRAYQMCESFIKDLNFRILNINDAQLMQTLVQTKLTGLDLKSSDFYIVATAIYCDCILLTLDEQIYDRVKPIYDFVFKDAIKLKEYLKPIRN